MSKWIPVKERLPEHGGYYLVSCEGGGVFRDFYWTDGTEWENKGYYDILAWRPLPKAYEEVEE